MTVRPLYSPPSPPAADPAGRIPEAAQAPTALSDAERQALAQQFPESPALSLRLYGPTRAHTEAAPALGSRLDLRG